MKNINIPDTDKKRIVILGGGFAGLALARDLKKSNYQIVLLDKNNYHQFQPLFYQVAMAGLEPSSISFPLRKIFQKCNNVFIRVAEVQKINTEQKTISSNLGNLSYDYLVVAVGADTNFFGNEALKEQCIPMKSVAEALYLRNAILEDYEKAITTTNYKNRQSLIDIVIVGGGATGVEVAGALAEMKKYILPKDYKELDSKEVDIHLIQSADSILKGMSEESSKAAERFLKDLGVIIKLNTRVTNVENGFVYTSDGEKIRAKKVIWAAGIKGNFLSGLPKDVWTYGNRLAVDGQNQLMGCPNIFAIGDIAYMEQEDKYPKGHPQVAQVAIQQAKNLAKNFKNLSKNKKLTNFKYKDLGAMATIGRHLAVVDLPNWKTQGTFAWFVWLIVHLFALIGVKNKFFVFFNWLWNYMTYDQSLRLIIRPKLKNNKLKQKT